MFSSAIQNVVGMSLVLGVASYGVGLVPLSVSLSKKQFSVLSNLSAGLLIGTALGVILPEGIEELTSDVEWNRSSSSSFAIGIPILLGFALMFLLEEYGTSHEQTLAHPSIIHSEEQFDVNLEELGRPPSPENLSMRHAESSDIQRAYSLTLGLIIHAIVDGYALGVSASNARSPSLSFVVFLAIIVHKAPTALALTTSLLASSLSVMDCRKHLLYFSLATPVSSILSYAFYTFQSGKYNGWSGSALLFSGGTFLYVASVVQPISGHASELSVGGISKMVRAMLLVGGMFFPVLVSRFVVHGP